MRSFCVSLSASLALLAAIMPAAAAEPAIQWVRRLTNSFSLTKVAEPAAVASAALFVSTDQGQSWQFVQEVPAPVGGKEFPKFTFEAPGDGVFGLYSRTVYSTGHREADPRPGTPPALTLVVDTTPPTFITAEAILSGTGAGLARFNATWAIRDTNLGDKPVVIEIAGDDGRFTSVGSGSAKGSLSLSVPVPGNATRLQVRFSATDSAGNITSNPLIILPLTAPHLSGEAREELTRAIQDLPSLAELGLAKTEVKPVAKPEVKIVVKTGPVALPTTAPAETQTSPVTPFPPPLIAEKSKPPASPFPTSDATVTESVAPAKPPAFPDPIVAPPSETPAGPPLVEDGKRSAPAHLSYATGEAAEVLLRDARVAVASKRYDDALDYYDRVLSSSRAADGAHDLSRLLTRLRRPKDLCTMVAALPSEFVDDQVRLEHARALVSLSRHAEAEKNLIAIGSRSPEAREARYLIALCWRNANRTNDANTVLRNLAQGNDAVAGWARAALGDR